MQPSIYSIRFSKVGKLYHFDAGHISDLKVGEYVVVETARGRQLGEVVQTVENPPSPPEGSWKSVERKATPGDLLLRQTWVQKQTEAMINCRARASELHLQGVKIVAAEYSYDGTRLTFMFSTETEDKVDLKSLRKDMQKLYPQSQVDMRQIGPRDVAKILGGMGACGLETRCCSKFLTEFSPISIKMAKEQGISLTPSEITGMCGRLRCCLVYEYEQYVAARKELPKRNKRVITPEGEGKVLDVYPLRDVVLVEFETQETRTRREYHRDVLEPWDELEALRRKAQAPCDRHEGGGCDCGKNEKKSEN
jgi:cell fate regulator YaaT (PSP1 superfamily)